MTKKQTKADFLRSWGINDPVALKAGFNNLRYKNPPEKGVYWHYISLEVRQRDVEKYGVCISCGKPISVNTCQAGHFMPAQNCGRDLLFDLRNVNAECAQCNAWDETHLLGYAEGLDKRYGEGTAKRLREMRDKHRQSHEVVKDWKAKEYAEKIKQLKSYQQRTLDKELLVI